MYLGKTGEPTIDALVCSREVPCDYGGIVEILKEANV